MLSVQDRVIIATFIGAMWFAAGFTIVDDWRKRKWHGVAVSAALGVLTWALTFSILGAVGK